jgi:hypothetical protein
MVDIARVACRGRLEDEDGGFLLGDRSMLDTS